MTDIGRPDWARVVTDHECDDWHDGECSECCRRSACPVCQES